MSKDLSKAKKDTTVIRDKPELKRSVLFAFLFSGKMEIYLKSRIIINIEFIEKNDFI